MSAKLEIFFYQTDLSMHLASFARALSDRGHRVTLVCVEGLLEERRKMGWNLPDFGGTHIVVSPSVEDVVRLVHEARLDSRHVFGATRSSWAIAKAALNECIHRGCRIGLRTEGADDAGFKGLARRVVYTKERLTVGRRYRFILAMGTIGVRWFERSGYPPTLIYPFAYTTDKPAASYAERSATGSFKIVFIGQLIPRKGVDVLIESLSLLSHFAWELVIVGDGPSASSLKRLSVKKDIDHRIQWLGTLPNDEIGHVLGASDLLVLPSRWDGWGAVINEALMAGVPVVCSDRVGARDLLNDHWRGEVFANGSVNALAGVLSSRIEAGRLKETHSRRISQWSDSISGDRVAQYLEEIFAHTDNLGPRPIPPWQ